MPGAKPAVASRKKKAAPKVRPRPVQAIKPTCPGCGSANLRHLPAERATKKLAKQAFPSAAAKFIAFKPQAQCQVCGWTVEVNA